MSPWLGKSDSGKHIFLFIARGVCVGALGLRVVVGGGGAVVAVPTQELQVDVGTQMEPAPPPTAPEGGPS